MNIDKISHYNSIISTLDNDQINKTSSNFSFQDFIVNNLENLNDKYLEIDSAQQSFALGEIESHELMTLLRETELVLKTATTFRNKMLDAYKEITNMQI